MPPLSIEITEDQLDSVLSCLESTLYAGLPPSEWRRGLNFAKAAEEAPPHERSWDVAQVAPIYRQLVARWTKDDTPVASVPSPEAQMYFAQEGVRPS